MMMANQQQILLIADVFKGSLFHRKFVKGSLLFPLHSLSHDGQGLLAPRPPPPPPRPPTTLSLQIPPLRWSEASHIDLRSTCSLAKTTHQHIINFAHIKLNLKIYIPTYKIQRTTYTTNKKKHTKCEWVRNWPCARGNTALN